MPGTAIVNAGAMVSGDIAHPLHAARGLLIQDGRIAALDPDAAVVARAERVIDAAGMTLVPGLIDSHTHPAIGDFTPRLTAVGWIENYLHGGVTSMISTGELHVPGRPHDPAGVKALSILACKTYRNARPSGVKVVGGTLILESGLQEADFREVAEAGVKAVKFIQAITDRAEAVQFSRWAKQYGLKVLIHCGGTSLPDVPTTTAKAIMEVEPDVLAHLNGGPTALSFEDIDLLVRQTPWIIDIVRFGNPKALLAMIKTVIEIGALERVVLGTDSPTGNGMEPLGMLHLITFLSACTDLRPEQAICMATGNTARAYDLPTGMILPGRAADLLLLDAPLGSVAKNALDAFALGDSPAVAMVMIDGKILVPRSRNTVPPQKSYDVKMRPSDP
jgi:enamidase